MELSGGGEEVELKVGEMELKAGEVELKAGAVSEGVLEPAGGGAQDCNLYFALLKMFITTPMLYNNLRNDKLLST